LGLDDEEEDDTLASLTAEEEERLGEAPELNRLLGDGLPVLSLEEERYTLCTSTSRPMSESTKTHTWPRMTASRIWNTRKDTSQQIQV
jgi:hypothetical protein